MAKCQNRSEQQCPVSRQVLQAAIPSLYQQQRAAHLRPRAPRAATGADIATPGPVLVADGVVVPAPATAQQLLSEHPDWSYTAALVRQQRLVIDWDLHIERLARCVLGQIARVLACSFRWQACSCSEQLGYSVGRQRHSMTHSTPLTAPSTVFPAQECGGAVAAAPACVCLLPAMAADAGVFASLTPPWTCSARMHCCSNSYKSSIKQRISRQHCCRGSHPCSYASVMQQVSLG